MQREADRRVTPALSIDLFWLPRFGRPGHVTRVSRAKPGDARCLLIQPVLAAVATFLDGVRTKVRGQLVDML
jgi:hypothetical protein